jgi:AcrR family transcriptional regulator
VTARRLTRGERKEATWGRLREVAVRLGTKDGFLHVRTLDVARAAGLSHGALFKHFPSRDALVEAAIQLVGKRLTDRLHELAQGRAGLRAALTVYLECVGEFEALYARLVTEAPHLPERARRTWLGVQSAICNHVSEALADDQCKKTIRNIPLHLLFNTWTGLVHHYLSQRDLFAPRGSVIARCGQELLEHFLDLVSVQPRR